MGAPRFNDTLKGSLVVLEPLSARHEAQLFEASREPEIWRWLPYNAATTDERFRGWLEEAIAEAEVEREAAFAIVYDRTRAAIGSTRYLNPCPEHRSVEIGWTWLARSAWQTGANTEAKLLMLRHAFERLGCVRVEFRADARNERSRAALAAIPAQFEGVLRKQRIWDGTARDVAYYSVVDEEWPAVRANLERRFAAKRAALKAGGSGE
jgi:N-acetyltransferase